MAVAAGSVERTIRPRMPALAFYAAVVLLLLFAQARAAAQATAIQATVPMQSDEDANQKVHLRAGRVTLPLVVVKGYPFLEGEINGIRGKLLFDLGEEASFVLNSHRIEPPNGRMAGHGYFGSGEAFPTYRFPFVNQVRLGSRLVFNAIPHVRGVPGDPIERRIAPDFIGWIGLGFFEGYILKLDYQRPSVSFYRNDADGAGMRAALKGETVLGVLHLYGPAHEHPRMFPVRIGTIPFGATFDTGSHDTLWLTPKLVAQMQAEGTIGEESASQSGSPAGHGFLLNSLSIGDHRFALQSRVEIARGRAPFAAQTAHPDENVLALGFEFLSAYKTVWDYSAQTVTLLQK